MYLSRADDGIDTVIYSATDLTNAAKCEWALLRALDAKLGRVPAVEEPEDSMLARAGRLGDAHEARELARLLELHGAHTPGSPGGVAEIDRPDLRDAAQLAAAVTATQDALRDGADVVFQATFFDGRFVGFADFLIRTGGAGAGEGAGADASEEDASHANTGFVYEVWDTKLARRAKVTALMQLAAYAVQLERLGIRVSPVVHLLLGNGVVTDHRLTDVLPAFEHRRARLQEMLDDRLAAGAAVEWGDSRYVACGRCATCQVEIDARRDVLLVAGARSSQRARLADVQVTTIDELASSTGAVHGIGSGPLAALRAQAALQVRGESAPGGTVLYEVYNPLPLRALPAPDAGDIFFDFEGDPLWSDAAGRDWGLEYLFGVVDHDAPAHDGAERTGRVENFRPFWAHDRDEEKAALTAFLDYVTERRRRHPNLHIYHYASYERTHLQQLTARHGVGEAQLDALLAADVLVDLYPVVKRSIRISKASYSLKKLEPLYMGSRLRESEVKDAGASIEQYVEYTRARERGDLAEADRLLAAIADYNEYDCASTLGLRDWLLARAGENHVAIDTESRALAELAIASAAPALLAETPLHAALLESVPVDALRRTPDEQALALAAAAIEYHRREEKAYWWEHFARQLDEPQDWAEQRGVLLVDSDTSSVTGEWFKEPGRQERRRLRLRGALAAGSRLEPGDRPFLMYDRPAPSWADELPAGRRPDHPSTSVVSVESVDGEFEVVIDELKKGTETWQQLPMAITPASPPPPRAQAAAILEWGEQVRAALPGYAANATFDILRRTPPRLKPRFSALAETGPLVPPADAIVASALSLDNSYLAVQGPPGSGKTYVAAQVIARLVVEHGWRIGVVAQSHSVVENVLAATLATGIDPALVGKKPSKDSPPTSSDGPGWTTLGSDGHAAFLAAHAASGCVIGGTAWDFANTKRVQRRELDLLVIDEAGQFSLANTIAVGVSARNLLLLGDPQQLPQVSQGLHPEPIDTSALGWLADGHDVLPREFGYFLAESWRMHPELCRSVSDLSYEGALRSKLPETTDRRLDGIRPGLHAVPVETTGNATESPEEADRCVAIAQSLLGRAWTDPSQDRVDSPLTASDIIVVAPYNAQVAKIRERLDQAGLEGTTVGTVDKFQGREAAVAIVSLTASSADDVPRGIDFLLMPNRLNVGISRAKWAAYLVHSPALREYLPHTAEGLSELSGFLRLTAERMDPEDADPEDVDLVGSAMAGATR
ncbi:TM0106 family RecB-like putative nuclease [Naasia lichenicola]|uniref:TM0106 family RecB-like putative nuclease n=2 Tax=Naasia lichenicola TaxID=2565933 RepID=A0A4S4FTE2_9MICO|nr:bifunctional RecB family nuclease/DEAD/DEAH box helicase [Naasia lichenicola]THG33598.1 TM0106 family RecB-like putative nuclease [Naasia lichenicola]